MIVKSLPLIDGKMADGILLDIHANTMTMALALPEGDERTVVVVLSGTRYDVST